MPIVDLDPQPLDSPLSTPVKAFVTPGLDDVEEKPRTVTPMTSGERALGVAAGVVPGGSLFYNVARGPAFAPSMRRDNLLSSAWSSESAWTDRAPDPDFNPYDVIKGTKYEQYPESFENVFNRRHYDAVTRDIDREVEDRKTLESLPWYHTVPATLMANMLDPTVLLPGGAFVRGAKGGFSMARTAASVGLGAGAQSAVQEAGLQAIQETRPFSESAINIGSSVLVGGLLGWGGAALLSPAEMRAAISAVDRQLGVTGSDAATIIEDIKPKLIAAGMSEEEASANAAIVAARYMTRAERLGEGTGADLYRAEMADVRKTAEPPSEMVSALGMSADELKARTFHQDDIVKAIRAYHGSPHDFDRFDMSKIGTGEGAQAYGHGLYFAENEGVARAYRDALGDAATIKLDGRPVSEVASQRAPYGQANSPEQQIADYVASYGTLQKARYTLANRRPELLPMFDELEKSGRLSPGGKMYEVNINAHPDQFIDWDAPLSKQPKLEQTMRRVGADPTGPGFEGPLTGAEGYRALQNKYFLDQIAGRGTNVRPQEVDAIASQAVGKMAQEGIPGIKYLDQGSRTAGEGSRNYVVFDDKLIEIVRKYQTDAKGTPRGSITLSENKAIIDLFSKADQSTFMHEAGHLWLEELVRDAARANVPQAIKDDLGTVLRWLKVEKVEDIGRAQHEQWAKAFERYLADGKAPSSALAQAFEKFKQWLTAIYKSLTEIGAPLSDDIRGVMDRMLATDAEIAQRGIPQGAVANSVGAAAVMAPAIADTAIAGRAAGAVAYATAKFNPGLRIAHAESAEARSVGMNLFEVSQYIRGNQDGFVSPQAVETLRKQWDGRLATAVDETRRAYREYRQRTGGYGLMDRVADLGPSSQMTSFYQEIGKAMRRGDQSEIPEVAKAAQTWRKEVFDPLKQAAIDVNLLPPDVSVDTAISYFSRIWNRKRLIAEEGQFKAVVQQWVADNFPRWVKGFEAAAERRLDPLRREIDDLEMAKLRRGEEAKQREAGGEIEDVNEADIRQAIRIVQGGAPKPKGVETLTQFVRNQGGLVEDGGELRHMGINNRSMPGLVRKDKRRIGAYNKMNDAGWDSDSMARHAWENGFFPEHSERPSRNEFLEALSDDFNKRRAVVREGDREAYRLTEMINRIEDDLARLGVTPTEGARFSTSEEVKGMVKRVYAALDAEADRKIAKLKEELTERQSKIDEEREVQFKGDVDEMGRDIANEVFDTLTGRTAEGPRPEFITVKARGPLKERTFNIPDEMIERWLESDIDLVGRRYTRVMSADVELARKFGSPDMEDQLGNAQKGIKGKVREDYDRLRQGVTDEKRLTALAKQEKSALEDLAAVRDIIRGNFAQAAWERDFGAIVRMANATQYILKMGQVVLSSLTEPVRVVAAKGLTPFMQDAFNGLSNLDALKLSVAEARLAGNVLDKVLSARLSTIADLTDFYSSRGPMEKFLDNMTNVASTWNGIRYWTDGVKMLASTMIQNKILGSVGRFTELNAADKRYLAFLGIDESMAGRIAEQFSKHGQDVNGVHVAGTANWDDVPRRAYYAALNKDLDSMVVTRGAADLPLFANTPMGKLLFQFNTFNLASHQRVLLRGLQEGYARFLSGVIALSSMGMLQTYLTALATNSTNKLPEFSENPGWWISEGLDKSGFFSVPMQIANGVEKLTGMNPIKSLIKLGDEGKQGSQKNRNRNELGLLGPSAGTLQDIGTVVGIPRTMAAGEDVTQAQKNAAERLMPFNSYAGIRQLLKYFVNPPQE